MQETPWKDNRPRSMMERSREAEHMHRQTPQTLDLVLLAALNRSHRPLKRNSKLRVSI